MTQRQTTGRWLFIGYVFFVVYGSLIPFDYRPLPLAQAWATASSLPFYRLGMQSRADWIANGVLYVPLGFLCAYWLSECSAKALTLPRWLAAGTLSLSLALAVEFAQIHFPPRTVSLNDLVAEAIGALVGLLLAARYGRWFSALIEALASRPDRLVARLLEAYLIAYIAFSLFPYDVLLSSSELTLKLRGNDWGWLVAGDHYGTAGIALKSLFEVLLTLPFGLFLGYRMTRRPPTLRQAALFGAVLGGAIEIAQLFMVTGLSQGLSIITRSAGVCAGLALSQGRANGVTQQYLRDGMRRHALLLGVLYLALLLLANGWFTQRWNGVDVALARLSEIHVQPFYYHYYTSEARALVSLTVTGVMYLPIGLLSWARHGTSVQALLLAGFVAALVETGKLFIPGPHADPTNLLLGAVSACGTVYLLRVLAAAARGKGVVAVAEPDALPDLPPPGPLIAATRPTPPRRIAYTLLLPPLAFCAYWTTAFPLPGALVVLVAAVLIASAAVVWSRPAWLIAIIPAALPVLDLAPWSGRFYFDEFDLLLIVTLAVGYARIPRVHALPGAPRRRRPVGGFSLACALLAASFAISALRSLIPWPTLDANAFTNYFSALNALRIFKGVLWAVLLHGVLGRLTTAGADVRRPLAWGMIVGLALTVAIIFWERIAFSGLFNFTADYRVTGPFSAMHIGGAYIECFLACAVPFVVLQIWQSRNWAIRLGGVLLLLATTYALMVTFSRNGYLAFALALAVVLLFALLRSARGRSYGVFAMALGAALVAVALPVFKGQFAQARMATVEQDYAVRQRHWQDALDMRAPDLLTTLFGMGLGRYPESHYLFSREGGRTGSYRFGNDGGNGYLRLVSGSSIYVEQLLTVIPRHTYSLQLDARANKPNVSMTIPICEKWLLTSYNCSWNGFRLGPETGNWRHFDVQVNTDHFRDAPWYSRRPIKLALYNGENLATIDVANVRLENAAGENLLRNGDFSAGLDHWFFSADSHLAWHTKSLPVAVLFDQGWLGLLAVGLFALIALAHGGRRAWRGDLHAGAALASFLAFLVVGLFDTLIDAPRFLMLFLLLGRFCGLGDSAGNDARPLSGPRKNPPPSH